MPTITSAGPSNAWEGQDPAEPETAATDVQDPAPVTPEPEPAADSKPEPAVEAPAPPPTSVFEACRTAAAPGPVEDGDKP